jgi:hypothetical protein
VRCESRPEDRVDTRRSRPRGECGEQPNIEADVAGLGCLDGRPRARAFTAVSVSLGHLKRKFRSLRVLCTEQLQQGWALATASISALPDVWQRARMRVRGELGALRL